MHIKEALAYFTKRVIAGLLVIIPIYLAILVLLKGMKSLGQLVRPFSKLLPDWLTAEQLLSLILVLLICSFIGAVLRTQLGQQVREWVERGVFENPRLRPVSQPDLAGGGGQPAKTHRPDHRRATQISNHQAT